MLRVTDGIVIEEAELDERFVRSSGPGGQNVNKVSTAVQLRFDVTRSRTLGAEIQSRLRSLAGSRLTSSGVIVIDARRHRTQAGNRQDARERLADLIRRAVVRPRRRRKTTPTARSTARRMESKRLRSQTKRERAKVAANE